MARISTVTTALFYCFHSELYLDAKVCAVLMPDLLSPLPTTSARLVFFESGRFPPERCHYSLLQVKLFKWPCVAKVPSCREYFGHSSHVHSVRFTKSDQYLVRPSSCSRSMSARAVTLSYARSR